VSITTLDSTASALLAVSALLATAEMTTLANLAAQPSNLMEPIMMAATATLPALALPATAPAMFAHPAALLLPPMGYTRMDASVPPMMSVYQSIVRATPASPHALTSSPDSTLMGASALQAVSVSQITAFPTLASPLATTLK